MFADKLEKFEDLGAETEAALERMLNDPKAYEQYLLNFFQENTMTELKKAVAAQNEEAALNISHTLKGVALTLGLLPLADYATDMVIALREKDPEAAWRAYPLLEETYNKFKAIMNEAD